MGLADLLLRKHTAIAKVVIPSGMAFGFFYTLNHGTNALTDAKSAVLGTPRVLAVSLVASPQIYNHWTILQLSFCMQLYRYSKRSCSIFFQAKLYWCRQQHQPVIQSKALLHPTSTAAPCTICTKSAGDSCRRPISCKILEYDQHNYLCWHLVLHQQAAVPYPSFASQVPNSGRC